MCLHYNNQQEYEIATAAPAPHKKELPISPDSGVVTFRPMTPAPHPLRCGTCTHSKKKENEWLPYCEKCGRHITTIFNDLICEIGCASHSASSEVLELIPARIAELQKELPGKTAKDMCVILALIGENQAMWAQIKEQMMRTKERER